MGFQMGSASVSKLLDRLELEHELDEAEETVHLVRSFSGGAVHLFISFHDVAGAPGVRTLRLMAMTKEPLPEKVRRNAPDILDAWASEREECLSDGAARIVDAYARVEGDALCWDWDWPFPAGMEVSEAFFKAVFDGFLKSVREDVNVVAVTLDGGWKLTGKELEVNAAGEHLGSLRYKHNRTGAVLEAAVTAEVYDGFGVHLRGLEQLTDVPGVKIVRDTSRVSRAH
ncbi:hypothetical protein AKJ09_05603 [Labilithrix luteola]|uniref:Uncharacterized protein n=1 Tax=Labilithrix luteola TaxID=1391654 RepID=A0A0K1Q0K1_9BACT|nr:hypothetical protein [Labilithrix luteola]AKU98939.1 hypothetical protein AKJ09_05603 [Labilithrix luteola]